MSRRTIFLSSSLGTTSRLWDAQVSLLEPHFGVLHAERRAERGVTMRDLAQQVIAQADAAGVERFSFAGISIGGAIGLELAALAPTRLERLVVACTSAHFGPPGPWQERAAIVRRAGVEAISDAVVSRWFTPAFHAEHPDVVRQFHDELEATPREPYAFLCEALGAYDVRNLLGSIRTSTLVLAGADDLAAPPEHDEEIASGIGCELIVLRDAAHLANVEQPQAFVTAMLHHLDEGAR
ncbi:MAG TPA: alpha/beta fold hydrolase [Gaiellaceae bacterium]